MSKNELMVAVAAILTTALEVGDVFPESGAYLALGGDIHKWEKVKDFLLMGGLATVKGYNIALTPKGRGLAEKIAAVLPAA